MFSEVSEIKLQKLNQWRTNVAADETVVGASVGDNGYGAVISMPDRDAKYLIMATNTSGSSPVTVRVKAGNGVNATAFEPAITLGASSSAIIQIESGCFKHVKDEGVMKAESAETSIMDKVFVTATTSTVKIKVFHTVM